MKDFENKNRGKFDNEWQSAFEDAEVQPSSSLWEKIDYRLTKQENNRFRKRLFFYRLVAGISLIAMAGLGIYHFELYPGNSSDSIAGQQTSPSGQGTNNTINEANEPGNTGHSGSIADSTQKNSDRQQDRNMVAAEASKNNQQDSANFSQPLTTIQSREKTGQNLPGSTGKKPVIPEQITSINFTHNAVFEKLPEVKKPIYRVPDYTYKAGKKEVKFLAGFNVSPDFFNPGYSSKSTNELASLFSFSSANDDATTELKTYLYQRNIEENTLGTTNSSSEITYGMENSPKLSASYGIDLGLKLNKKWSLNSGLNYKQLVATTSTSAIWSQTGTSEKMPLTVNNEQEVFKLADSDIEINQNQSINNAFDFVNVPLHLGYRFNLEPISLEISSGIGANFLIMNSLSGTGNNNDLTEVKLHPGQNTPFRNIYLNSQVRGSINYNFLSNYYLSLTPYYNLSITSFTKPESNFNSSPRYYGLQFGLRYEF